MSNVHPFTPRHSSDALLALLVLTPAEFRRQLEEAAQDALDTADRLLAILDRLDGDTDREDGGDAEPSLAAPENHASQIVWLRGSSSDTEQDLAR